ncbi:DUF2848 domain-containing protein [Kushneria phosphatilytica]|uniref:DUF2848 domain-containing protein n=1 Tax=Kushneria phosphatilytica TaxID=657387 RepID=A0A1S1NY98_9GAMM|nr:DUF2848 domain-containing protein [Kushneria phosphatilytica]OHV12753.1 hypothetical protein BH688_01485 [Kushneria phosphatilytica]QEL10594.1 DUF2848 domain-containing protein [Kushneria phosphatilytica]
MPVFHHGSERHEIVIHRIAIAGWAGRDQTAVQHHIDELAELGVKPPSTTPLFYRCSEWLVTQQSRIQMLGEAGSGEVEVCLLSDEEGRLWVTVGSDHTDRKLEAVGVAESKQLCAKPIGRDIWAFDEIRPHWDQLLLESHIEEAGESVCYQHGTLAELLDPAELFARLPEEIARNGELAPHTALWCGTVPARGGVRSSRRFDMALLDPVHNRRIEHGYTIDVLPIVQ